MTPTLGIDLSASQRSVTEQISSRLRALLVAREIAPGTLLPPVRQLALDLGIHHNTVAEAYRRLAAEGWLDLRRRRGALVIERQVPRPEPHEITLFISELESLVAGALAAGLPARRLGQELDRAAARLRQGGTP